MTPLHKGAPPLHLSNKQKRGLTRAKGSRVRNPPHLCQRGPWLRSFLERVGLWVGSGTNSSSWPNSSCAWASTTCRKPMVSTAGWPQQTEVRSVHCRERCCRPEQSTRMSSATKDANKVMLIVHASIASSQSAVNVLWLCTCTCERHLRFARFVHFSGASCGP